MQKTEIYGGYKIVMDVEPSSISVSIYPLEEKWTQKVSQFIWRLLFVPADLLALHYFQTTISPGHVLNSVQESESLEKAYAWIDRYNQIRGVNQNG